MEGPECTSALGCSPLSREHLHSTPQATWHGHHQYGATWPFSSCAWPRTCEERHVKTHRVPGSAQICTGSQRFWKIRKCSSCCNEPAEVRADQRMVQSFDGDIHKLLRLRGLISYLQTNSNYCQDRSFSRGGEEPLRNLMSGWGHLEAALVDMTRQWHCLRCLACLGSPLPWWHCCTRAVADFGMTKCL